jgi:hypothetical protein
MLAVPRFNYDFKGAIWQITLVEGYIFTLKSI